MSGGVAVVLARLASLGAAAIQLPLLARLLSPSDFTFTMAAVAASAYVSLLAFEPTSLAFQRFAGTGENRSNYVFGLGQLTKYAVLLGLIISIAGVVVDKLDFALALVGWGFGLGSMRFVSTAWLMWEMPWRYSLNIVASTLIRTSSLLALILTGSNPMLAVACAGFSSTVIAVLLGPTRKAAARGSRPWPKWLGASLATASVGVTVIQSSDRLIVPAVVGATAAAGYAAMASLASLTLGSVLSTMNTVMYPRVVNPWHRGDAAKAFDGIRFAWITAVGAIAIAFACAVCFPILAEFAVGEELAQPPILAGLLCAVGLYGLGLLASWTFHLSLATSALRNRSLFTAALTVAGLVLGATLGGTQGAVVGMIAGSLTYCTALLVHGSGAFPYQMAACCVAAAGSWVVLVPWDFRLPSLLFIVAAVLLSVAGRIGVAARPPRRETAGLRGEQNWYT